MRQRSRLVVLALAALVGLAGCAGSPGSDAPAPTQSVESSPPPASEVEVPEPEELEDVVPTPEPLSLPEYPEDLTAEDTAENAILAAEYFMEQLNHMQSTGTVEHFEALSVNTCATCERMIALQLERYESDGYLVGNEIALSKSLAERTEDGLGWVVTADAIATDGIEIIAGEVERRIPGRVEKGFRLGVQLINGDWRMLEFARGKQ